MWERILGTKLKNVQESFPTIINPGVIDAQTSALTNIIIDSATDFFGNTETSKKISNDVSIRFLTSSVEERINTSIEVSENTMEYFLKNVKYVLVFQLNNRKKPMN